MDFKSATTMLDHQKNLQKMTLNLFCLSFIKKMILGRFLFPGDDGYKDH